MDSDYKIGFKGARKLPTSVVEMNCPFAILLSHRLDVVYTLSFQSYIVVNTI